MFGAARLNTLAKFTAAAAVAGWALSSAAYASKSKSTSAEFTAPTGVSFKTDGTKMYVVQSTIRSYSLSTAWDVSTATYDNVSFTLGATAQDVVWKPDGTIFYICIFGDYPNTIKQYACSTAWDISTASLTTTKGLVLTGGDSPRSMFFRDNGTKMYIGTSDGYLYDCTLSTAWSVSTASVTTNVSLGEAIYGLSFKSDGTKLIIVNNDIVKEYTMSSAWTISGLTDTNVTLGLNLDTQDFGYTGLFVKTDGDAFYITNTDSDKVYQFSMSGARTAKNISVFGNPQVSTTQSKFGGASAYINAITGGSNNALQIPQNDDFKWGAFTNYTIEAWVYHTAWQPTASANTGEGSASVISLSRSTGFIVWCFGFNEVGKITLDYSTSGGFGGTTIQETTTTGALNTWQHIAMVKTGSSVALYVNGVSKATGTISGTVTYGASENLRIGQQYWGGTLYVDDLRMSKTNRYTAGFTPSTVAFGNDINTLLLIHANGTNGSTVFTDDNA